MYSIERTAENIIVRGGPMNRAIFMAPPDSLILHNSKSAGGSTIVVSKIKDLSDENLLLALANVVEIKEFTHDKS